MSSPALRMIFHESAEISTRAPTGSPANLGEVVGRMEESVVGSLERARRNGCSVDAVRLSD